MAAVARAVRPRVRQKRQERPQAASARVPVLTDHRQALRLLARQEDPPAGAVARLELTADRAQGVAVHSAPDPA